MKRVWITRVGPPEVLKLLEEPDPQPEVLEVRIKVKAIGVNFSDILARLGVYPEAPPLPCVIGYEVSGIIDKVGKEVKRFKVGDEVIALTNFGGYSDNIVIHENRVYKLPNGFSFSKGAGLIVNYLTAYLLLFEIARIKKKDTILVHSAAGGVGLAILELSRRIGVTTIGVASTFKHESLQKMGINFVIDSKREIVDSVIKFTHGAGVDIIFDPIGPSSWEESFRLLKPMGKLCIYGNSDIVIGKGEDWTKSLASYNETSFRKMELFSLISENKGIFGLHVGRLFNNETLIKKAIINIIELANKGEISPRIDKEFPLEKASEAHNYIQERKNIGKVVLITE